MTASRTAPARRAINLLTSILGTGLSMRARIRRTPSSSAWRRSWFKSAPFSSIRFKRAPLGMRQTVTYEPLPSAPVEAGALRDRLEGLRDEIFEACRGRRVSGGGELLGG